MALHSTFLHFLLPKQVLVLRCVVVIREYLGEKHIHVVCLSFLSLSVRNTNWPNRSANGYGLGLIGNLLFHALVAKVEHLTGERLCHEGLTWITGWLRMVLCVDHSV